MDILLMNRSSLSLGSLGSSLRSQSLRRSGDKLFWRRAKPTPRSRRSRSSGALRTSLRSKVERIGWADIGGRGSRRLSRGSSYSLGRSLKSRGSLYGGERGLAKGVLGRRGGGDGRRSGLKSRSRLGRSFSMSRSSRPSRPSLSRSTLP